ncbi:MAG: glucose-1-phosphate adenylyltransferase [Anaerolineaceae bacterium]|nr:glucose-1-phosphate adenylyltransferase [Anaerolineaceae bacterium]
MNNDETLAVILGGGRGTRLFPLTQIRSKPAVPIAGQYRLIDIPISNCINSNIFKIAVLTQFNSVSLHRHITDTYQFDRFHSGWVQIWAAEQTMDNADWYQGTADAVRKQLSQIVSANCKYVLILAGDHLYRCNYDEMLQFHKEHNAAVTVAVQPVRKEEAPRLGLLKTNEEGRIIDFKEKPKDPIIIESMKSTDDPERPILGSMGIYIFNTDLLVDILTTKDYSDFGNNVIPYAIDHSDVFGWRFEDYWEDIGTIRSFYETNLALTNDKPPFNFYDPKHPIYTIATTMPSAKVFNTRLDHVLIARGARVKAESIERSIVGVMSYIDTGTVIKNSIIMGAENEKYILQADQNSEEFGVKIGIGKNCHIENAIIDKNARIGNNVIIKPFPAGTELDDPAEEKRYYVRDGIVVIPKNAVIESNTVIEP